jgi:hypothetical protein
MPAQCDGKQKNRRRGGRGGIRRAMHADPAGRETAASRHVRRRSICTRPSTAIARRRFSVDVQLYD